jgi:hypothetical protein
MSCPLRRALVKSLVPVLLGAAAMPVALAQRSSGQDSQTPPLSSAQLLAGAGQTQPSTDAQPQVISVPTTVQTQIPAVPPQAAGTQAAAVPAAPADTKTLDEIQKEADAELAARAQAAAAANAAAAPAASTAAAPAAASGSAVQDGAAVQNEPAQNEPAVAASQVEPAQPSAPAPQSPAIAYTQATAASVATAPPVAVSAAPVPSPAAALPATSMPQSAPPEPAVHFVQPGVTQEASVRADQPMLPGQQAASDEAVKQAAAEAGITSGSSVAMPQDGRCQSVHPGDVVNFTLKIEEAQAAHVVFTNLHLSAGRVGHYREADLPLSDGNVLDGGGIGTRDAADENVYHFRMMVPDVASGIYRVEGVSVRAAFTADSADGGVSVRLTKRARAEVRGYCLAVFTSGSGDHRLRVTQFRRGMVDVSKEPPPLLALR